MIQFTYESYEMMLKNLIDGGYSFKNYINWAEEKRTVILRHDVDYSLEKAVHMSEIEKKMQVGGAIYFVLLSTNFYNVHSKESKEYVARIIKNGGSIGLHFDETQYDISSEKEIEEYVYGEVESLSNALGTEINVVSMHRPSEKFLSQDIKFDNIINSYEHTFFSDMKYLSDSRRSWRENVDEIISERIYERLHILTHPIWYTRNEEKNLKQTLRENILSAALDYYDNMNNNFRDLGKEIGRSEIEKIICNYISTEMKKEGGER